MFDLDRRNRDGESFPDLASAVNRSFVRELQAYIADERAFVAALPGFRTLGDVDKWRAESGHRGDGYKNALRLLLAMGRSELEAKEDWCDVALEMLREGCDAADILEAMPVSGDRLKDQLRHWREKRKSYGGKK